MTPTPERDPLRAEFEGNDMTSTPEREAFEAWFSDGGESPRAIERSAVGGYKLAAAQTGWSVWQQAWGAARVPQAAASLPEITDEDRKFLHYNPITSDLVGFVQEYARGAIAQAEASRVATLIAEVRQLLDNAEYGDGNGVILTQDAEAVEQALDDLDLSAPPRVGEPVTLDVEALLAAERERLCAAIKAADDQAAEGGYMLDSDDCISVVRGTWHQGPSDLDVDPDQNPAGPTYVPASEAP